MHRFEDSAQLRPTGSWPELIERSRQRGSALRRRRRVARAAVPMVAVLVLIGGFQAANVIGGPDGSSSLRLTGNPRHGPSGLPSQIDGASSGGNGRSDRSDARRGAGGTPGQTPQTGRGAESTNPMTGKTGHIVFTSDRDGTDHIYVMNADGSDVRQLTTGLAWDSEPTLSPDGTRVAFTRSGQDPRADYQHAEDSVYTIGLDGSDLTAMQMPMDASADDPAWSPDGTELAYRLQQGNTGTSRVWVSDPHGDNPRSITPQDMHAYWPAWSPDGTRLVFHIVARTTSQAGPVGLFVADASDGADLRQITSGEDFSPAWSPDGRTIAFSSLRDGKSDLYFVDLATVRETRITDATTFDSSPSWSPDGTMLLFDRDPDRSAMTGCTDLPLSPTPQSREACAGQPSPTGPAPAALWSLDLRNHRQQQLTSSGSNDTEPEWGR